MPGAPSGHGQSTWRPASQTEPTGAGPHAATASMRPATIPAFMRLSLSSAPSPEYADHRRRATGRVFPALLRRTIAPSGRLRVAAPRPDLGRHRVRHEPELLRDLLVGRARSVIVVANHEALFTDEPV